MVIDLLQVAKKKNCVMFKRFVTAVRLFYKMLGGWYLISLVIFISISYRNQSLYTMVVTSSVCVCVCACVRA